MGLFDRLVIAGLPLVPRRVLWTVARRYVAGQSLDEALARITALRAEGFDTILDILGEGESSEAQARAAAASYHELLAPLAPVDPHCTIAVKPTHLGLLHSEDLCAELLAELCVAAAAAQRFVRFEMEDAPTIDGTLRVFETVREQHSNLGCVLQSRLFRTGSDLERLLTRFPDLNVRLVKGIYLEPASIAHTDHAAITRAYLELADRLLESDGHVGLATHDDEIVAHTQATIRRLELDAPPQHERRHEYQLLMGVRKPLAEQLRDAGHRVRIYVPFGADWHAYTLRRLKYNPEIARHVMRAVLRGD
ncbi:MAG: proline dehydrogenase [Planctomycetota bacterium]|nr:MAG: proline dehydrogenase [Planctomycetota bacterium]